RSWWRLLSTALISADREVTIADLRRTFTIRINDGVAATLASAAVEATAAVAPGVTLRFVTEGSESIEALRDGSVDLDIGAGDVAAPDIRTAVLYRERMVGIVGGGQGGGARRRQAYPLSDLPIVQDDGIAARSWPGRPATRRGRDGLPGG
ncbi:LysR substrate-binding domain-containing protein, partial [Streptosporangium sp. NPDC005286]|uniref:LysR substrate-binding domain-containing protein n=1 Tax=Streptosporangium sp. NPDC005286 TaxID=3154463 RepID=UPI0033A21B91